MVGSDSLLNEVELMQIVDTVFSRFNIRVCIKINNRKILSGIAEIIGESDKIVDISISIEGVSICWKPYKWYTSRIVLNI